MAIISHGYPGGSTAGAIVPRFAHLVDDYVMDAEPSDISPSLGGPFRVTAAISGTRRVNIAGPTDKYAYGKGVIVRQDAASTMDLPAPSGSSQWFAVVINRWVGAPPYSSTLSYVAGTSARAIPDYLATSDGGSLDQEPVALVRVTAASTLVQEVVDLRLLWFPGDAYYTAFSDLGMSRLDGVRGAIVYRHDLGSTWIYSETGWIPYDPQPDFTRFYVETLTIPDSGAFVIGRSFVGDALTEADVELLWTDIGCEARNVHIERGGKRTGVATTLDVGTLSMTTVNAWDPADHPTIKPNTPIRVEADVPSGVQNFGWDWRGGETVVWENTSETGSVTIGADPWGTGDALLIDKGAGSFPGARSGIYVMDGSIKVEVVARNYDVAGCGSGAIRLYNADTNTVLAQGSASSVAYHTVTLSYDAPGPIPVYVSITGSEFSTAVWSVRLFNNAPTFKRTRLFTGNLEDVQVDFDREDNTFVTITAADAVKQHNNVQRYGAVVEGGVGYEPWANRIRRLAASAITDVNVPGPEADQSREVYRYDAFRTYPTTFTGRKDGWSTYGELGGGTLDGPYGRTGSSDDMLRWVRASTANISITPGSTGVRRTLTDLKIGAHYRVQAGLFTYYNPPSGFTTWAIGVTGKGWGEPATQVAGQLIPLSYEFTATATSHQVNIALYMSGSYDATSLSDYVSVYFSNITVLETTTDLVLQDVVYESSLANHFDLASNSVGGSWWVDEYNVTQFAASLPGTDPLVARFSDVHEDIPIAGAAPHVCYTDVQVGYDTTNVVNDLAVVNHGRDAVTGDAADVTYSVRDVTSSANWGPRQATIDTSLKNDDTYTGSIDRVAGWILEASKDAALAVTSVTFRGDKFANVQQALDINSRVSVTRRGVDYPCRVTSITHDIEATTGRWFTTLGLTKEINNG